VRGRKLSVHARLSIRRDHSRRSRAYASEHDDCRCYNSRLAAYMWSTAHRRRSHATRRRSDDRRNGILDSAYADRHSERTVPFHSPGSVFRPVGNSFGRRRALRWV
jgi:hypothetical protein